MRVQAVRDVTSAGGMRIARKGQEGLVAARCTPSRPQQYGRVPVLWGERSRAYWSPPEDLKVLSGDGELNDFVVSPPTLEEILRLPEMRDSRPMFDFGANLLLLRRTRDMSQAELAENMHARGISRISQATISKWEARKDSPSGAFVQAASEALEVPPFVFFLDLRELGNSRDYVESLQSLVDSYVEKGGALGRAAAD